MERACYFASSCSRLAHDQNRMVCHRQPAKKGTRIFRRGRMAKKRERNAPRIESVAQARQRFWRRAPIALNAAVTTSIAASDGTRSIVEPPM